MASDAAIALISVVPTAAVGLAGLLVSWSANNAANARERERLSAENERLSRSFDEDRRRDRREAYVGLLGSLDELDAMGTGYAYADHEAFRDWTVAFYRAFNYCDLLAEREVRAALLSLEETIKTGVPPLSWTPCD